MIIATGISSVATQLVTIREFLSSFSGNEYIIALIIFLWLILGGAGTLLARWFSRYFLSTPVRLGYLSALLVILSPAQIMAIRHFRDALFLTGASVGFYPTLVYLLITISPYAILVGLVLPYSLFVIRTEVPDYSGTPIYLTDSVGDVLGGALFSFFLVYFFSPMQAIFLANLPLLLLCFFLVKKTGKKNFGGLIFLGIVFSGLVVGLTWEKPSLSQMHNGNLVFYQDSRYQRITIYQKQDQYTLFTDGSPLFSNQNLFTAEERVHYPLSQVPNPQNILLISATSGLLREVRKYQPSRVDYVELDPALTKVQFDYGFLEKIPNLNIIHQDGRKYLAETDQKYQAIILAYSEPRTFKANRYFTSEFFSLVKKHLTDKGVFSFSIEGFDNYPTSAQRKKISSLYQTAEKSFANLLMLPGREIYFLCSGKSLYWDIPSLMEEKDIATEYIQNFFYGNITQDRISYLQGLVKEEVNENLDLNPSLMQIMFKQWFKKHAQSPWPFFTGITMVMIFYLFLISREEFVLLSTGLTTMGTEIIIIFAVQIFFGYIYHYVGFIVTVFLAGLFPGAVLGEYLRKRGRELLFITDLALIFSLAVLILCLQLAGKELPLAFFPGFGLLIAILCGFQFPVALDLRGGDNPAVSRTFSADLIGASFGALIPSTVLIPLVGIIWTIVTIIIIKLISLLIIGVFS